MDNIPLIIGSGILGTILLDLALRAFWVRPYFQLGFKSFQTERQISPNTEIDTWKLLSANDNTFYHSIEYKSLQNSQFLLREEITFSSTEGMTKRFYTPAIHALIKYDRLSGKISIEGRFDPIPSLVIILSFCVPIFLISLVWFVDRSQFFQSFVLLGVPVVVVAIFLAIARVQQGRYLKIFNAISTK